MKFSIIVPVYNSEKYLEKCILSVIQQSYNNWELILIDDGSSDSSRIIAEKYSKNDNRIIVINQENAGPGIARNNGIDRATGEYIVFLDSDDYIDEEYLSLLKDKAQNSDVVFIDVMQISEDGILIQKELISDYKKSSKDNILRSQMTGKIPWGGVRKAVRREVIIRNNIRYTNHKVGEEALYSFRVLYLAKSIKFLYEKPVYYYVNHENSQSKTLMDDPWGEVVETVINYLKENNLYDKFSNTTNALAITALVISIDRINLFYKGEVKKQRIAKRLSEFKKNYDYSVKIDYSNIDFKAKIFAPFILKEMIGPILLFSGLRRTLRKIR